MFKLKRFNRILLFKDLWLVWTHNQRPYLLLIISNKRNFFFWVELEISQIIVKLSLSISIYLNLSLSLRDRADTIITFHPHHIKLFLRTLELTYTQVWYIIGIVSSSPTHFHSERIGLIRGSYGLPCQC